MDICPICGLHMSHPDCFCTYVKRSKKKKKAPKKSEKAFQLTVSKKDMKELKKLNKELDEYHESDEQWDMDDLVNQGNIARDFSRIIEAAIKTAKPT